MKRLQEETMTKMAVLGRGSMRDKQKVRKAVAFCHIYHCVKMAFSGPWPKNLRKVVGRKSSLNETSFF